MSAAGGNWMDKIKKASKGVVDAGAKQMLKVGFSRGWVAASWVRSHRRFAG